MQSCIGGFFVSAPWGLFGLGNVLFGTADVLLKLALKLLGPALDVLAGVVGDIAQIATDFALHFLGGAFDLVVETSVVQISLVLILHTPSLMKSTCFHTLGTQSTCPV